jgi:putative membrane protein
MLVKDHTDNNEKAVQLANNVGMAPPTGPNADQKATYDRLSELSAAAFDREFLSYMVDDQQKIFKAFEAAAHNPSRAIDDYARASIATMKRHLDTAVALLKDKALPH